MQVIRGIQRRPRRILLYGTHGIGKSTWAAAAPSPIFLQTEDGLADIGVDRTPLLKELGQVNDWLSYLMTGEHSYKTVVIDTLDWLEHLVFNATAAAAQKNSIEDIVYGKGYTFALKHWEFLLNSLSHLRDRGLAVILLAHARAVKVEPPDADTYTRYEPDLHKTVSPMLQEWCDEVLFATYKVNTIARDEGFNRERTRAIGSGERVVYTREKPTHLAKRRIPLPDYLPLDFGAYGQHVSAAREAAPQQSPQPQPSGDIAGVVTNGHSKPQPQPQTAGAQ